MGSVSNRVLLCRWTTVNQGLINAASHLLSKIHSLCVQLIGALHAPLILSSLRQDDRGGDEFEERYPNCCDAAKPGCRAWKRSIGCIGWKLPRGPLMIGGSSPQLGS